MDGDSHIETQDSGVLKNVQSDHLEESSNSNCAMATENVPHSDTGKENMPLSSENDETFPKETANSECTLGEKQGEAVQNGYTSASENSTNTGNLSEAVILTSKPLCADYRSGSDSESIDSVSDSSSDSDSDTSTTETCSTSETSSESEDEDGIHGLDKKKEHEIKKKQTDLSLLDLPPIEDLKISVPENDCVEVGQISGIVDTLVVVESYKGTAALDIDTVLFLDCGKRTLGKIFDVLGPITEPVYTVRFNNQDQIQSLNIERGQKVYYAPKTQHTMFVFLSEVLKNRGSDASWKDNVEAPSEFQDFSDDEKERQHKDKNKKESDGENTISKEGNQSRKRSFSKSKQTSGILQQSRFRYPSASDQRRQNFPRNPPPNHSAPPPAFPAPVIPNPAFPASVIPNPAQPPAFPYTIPPYPGTNYFVTTPHVYYPPRFSGPAFPPFGGQFPFAHRGFHQPFFQQKSHAYRQGMGGMWGAPMFRPPPPPPPPEGQEHSDGKPT